MIILSGLKEDCDLKKNVKLEGWIWWIVYGRNERELKEWYSRNGWNEERREVG